MLWVRNIEHLRRRRDNFEVLECEFASEAEIHGVLSFGNSAILAAASTSTRNPDGLLKYDLVIKVARIRGLGPVSKHGYVFREGLAGELAAIISFALQARTYITSTRWGGLGPSRMSTKQEFPIIRNPSTARDPVVLGDKARNFRDVKPVLSRLSRVPGRFHYRVILAINHYARALREIGLDEEMAFVRLVSAVEALARDYRIENDVLEGFEFSEIVRTELLNAEQTSELKKTFEVRKARQRFTEFLVEYSTSFLRGGRTKAPHTRITRKQLPDVLDAIYRARSTYLHEGTPMFLSTGVGRFPVWHTDPVVGQIIQNREFRLQDKLPYLHFFHRLVQHSATRYINRLARSLR